MSRPDDIAAAKRELRTRVKQRLAALDAQDVADRSHAICAHLLASDLWRRAVAFSPDAPAPAVMSYNAMPGEPDPAGIAAECVRAGLRLCLPRMDWDARTIEACLVAPDQIDDTGLLLDAEVRRFGIPEPPGRCPRLDPRDLAVVVTPGLVFDQVGGRIGRGAGFYDRFFSRMTEGVRDRPRPALIGFAITDQLADETPADTHDQRMDAVVTELGLTRGAGAGGAWANET